MSRQSSEKWYTSQRLWHDCRYYECARKLEWQRLSWHRQERDWYSAQLAALSVKGK